MNNVLNTKWLITVILFLFLNACGEQAQNQKKNQKNNLVISEIESSKNNTLDKISSTLSTETKIRLINELALAKKNNDTRLFATKGRRVVIVGIDPEKFEQVKKMCGIKFLSNSGDVIKNEQDKAARLANYRFAQAYNKQIVGGCLN